MNHVVKGTLKLSGCVAGHGIDSLWYKAQGSLSAPLDTGTKWFPSVCSSNYKWRVTLIHFCTIDYVQSSCNSPV